MHVLVICAYFGVGMKSGLLHGFPKPHNESMSSLGFDHACKDSLEISVG